MVRKFAHVQTYMSGMMISVIRKLNDVTGWKTCSHKSTSGNRNFIPK